MKIKKAEISRVQDGNDSCPVATEDRSFPGTHMFTPMPGIQCRLQWTVAACMLWCGAVEISVDAVILATALEVKDNRRHHFNEIEQKRAVKRIFRRTHS